MTRELRHDAALAAVAGLAAAAEFAIAGATDSAGDRNAAAAAGLALAASSVALRRRDPRLCWVVALAGFTLFTLASGIVDLVSYALAIFAVYNAGRRDGSRWSWVAPAALVAICEGVSLATHSDSAMYWFLTPLVWFGGRAVYEREQLADRLAERAAELEGEREAYAALSVRYERARIAADLHDIVAHALSVMVVQAGAGQRLAGRDEALTAETFAAISESARGAEQDMGRLVALLGEPDAIGAAPDLHVVEELVRRAAGSGRDVRLRLEGDREGLPAEVVEAACRVVQESLTNALRYASGAAVGVLVAGEAEALVVEVVNSAAPAHRALAGAGTGTGLRGLRERVGACGGKLEAGPALGGGWSVRARLPRRVAVAA